MALVGIEIMTKLIRLPIPLLLFITILRSQSHSCIVMAWTPTFTPPPPPLPPIVTNQFHPININTNGLTTRRRRTYGLPLLVTRNPIPTTTTSNTASNIASSTSSLSSSSSKTQPQHKNKNNKHKKK